MDLIRFIKFGMVGFSGLVIDFFITWLFKEKIGLNKYFSNGLGFLFGVVNNYFLNKYFTFHNNDTHLASQFFNFLIISVIGFALNTTLLYLLQKNTKINFYVCKAIVTIMVFFWNFSANALYTFKK
ncbi:GtrA family protein [Flavobacterium sp. 123]|jgi:putative flippase GtrA|uniref:GtrA family protein n=1 Tax=Flavobacterium sp. 123 TaxID=2135627 RepID=UPI000EAB8A0E|nr:GtrA family protein [Flavobacterium sp. 123]RKS99180.1 putative flippase GtrA [Flavobacterium sp. 123]